MLYWHTTNMIGKNDTRLYVENKTWSFGLVVGYFGIINDPRLSKYTKDDSHNSTKPDSIIYYLFTTTCLQDPDMVQFNMMTSSSNGNIFRVDRWIPHTNGQWRRKYLHLMTSSRVDEKM